MYIGTPENVVTIPEYRSHKNEINCFKDYIINSHVQFMAYSYNELWRSWSESIDDMTISKHIEKLKQRYYFSI